MYLDQNEASARNKRASPLRLRDNGPDNDDYLMSRVAMSDMEALRQLELKYWTDFEGERDKVGGKKGYFLTRSNGCVDASHLTSLVFDKVKRYAASYKPRGRFKSWLYSIARNLLFDELKRQARECDRISLHNLTNSPNPWNYGTSGGKRRSHEYAPRDNDDIDGASGSGYSRVIDAHFELRAVDITIRFKPRRGYSTSAEVRRMFRRFGLVDPPVEKLPWMKNK